MVQTDSCRVSRTPHYSGYLKVVLNFAHSTFTFYGRTFQSVKLALNIPLSRSHNPEETSFLGLGCSAFARHYLRNHFCFLLLGLLRCFTSPRVASTGLYIQPEIIPHYRNWVSPFGNPRVNACLWLTAAYRNLLRPSSPPSTKAFTNCP